MVLLRHSLAADFFWKGIKQVITGLPCLHEFEMILVVVGKLSK